MSDTTFACLQEFSLCIASSALNYLLCVHRARMGVQSSPGRVLANLVPGDRIGQCYSVGRDARWILPCGQGRIDSVKINPSLLMMREWIIWSRKILSFNSILVVSEYSAMNIDINTQWWENGWYCAPNPISSRYLFGFTSGPVSQWVGWWVIVSDFGEIAIASTELVLEADLKFQCFRLSLFKKAWPQLPEAVVCGLFMVAQKD